MDPICVMDVRRMDGGADFTVSFIHHDILHPVNGHELCFQFFGIDVFTVAEDDQIFGAAGDIQISVLIQISQIPGAEPSVFRDHLCGRLGILVISQHHTIAFYKDLAVFDFCGHTGDRFSHGAKPVSSGVIARNKRCAFRKTVSLEHVYAKFGEGFRNILTKCRTADNNTCQIPAEFVQQAFVQLSSDIDSENAAYTVDSFCECDFSLICSRSDTIHDFLVKCFRNRGNNKNETGLEPIHIGCDIFKSVIDADGYTPIQHSKVTDGQLIGMVDRQNGHCDRFTVRFIKDVQAVIIRYIGA